jgi:hypothetical protein
VRISAPRRIRPINLERLAELQSPAMRSDDAKAWSERWKIVAREEIAELRAASPEVKLRQLEALFASAELFRWPDDDAEDARVRGLWSALRRRSGLS